MEGWCCTHENCTHTGKTGQRVQYASQYASWRHERTRRYHNCGQSCAACERWDGKTTGKAPPSDPWCCRHTNGCQRAFANDCTRCTHELHDVHINVERRKEELLVMKERMDINWEKMAEESKGKSEKTYRRQQAEALLRSIYPQYSFVEAMHALVKGDEATINYLKANIQEFAAELEQNKPALDVLLAFKEHVGITDKDWKYAMTVFNLKGNTSVHYLNKRKAVLTKSMEPRPTPGKQGYELPLLVKFAFDGATMTKGKGKKQEVGTFDFLFDNLELAKAKSVYNAHQYIVYIGEESREELEKELKNAVKGIEYLINGGTIKAHGIDYALEPVLVCDMAALIKVLGLYTCYHPKSQWKCPWCLVNMDNISDFTREMWPFRDETQMWTKGEEALLRILFNHVIPCQLHCFMGVMRKLVEQLAEYTHGKKKLCKEVEKCFVATKITLPKRNDKMKTLEQRVAKARFGRPDYIRILENRALFLKAVEKRARRRKSQERAANIKQLWDRFALLASLASQPKVTLISMSSFITLDSSN